MNPNRKQWATTVPHIEAMIGHATFRGFKPIPGEIHIVLTSEVSIELVQTSKYQFRARYAGTKAPFKDIMGTISGPIDKVQFRVAQRFEKMTKAWSWTDRTGKPAGVAPVPREPARRKTR